MYMADEWPFWRAGMVEGLWWMKDELGLCLKEGIRFDDAGLYLSGVCLCLKEYCVLV